MSNLHYFLVIIISFLTGFLVGIAIWNEKVEKQKTSFDEEWNSDEDKIWDKL